MALCLDIITLKLAVTIHDERNNRESREIDSGNSTTTHVEGNRAVHGDVPISSSTKIQQAIGTHDIHPITKDGDQPNTHKPDSRNENTKTTTPDGQDTVAEPKAAHNDDNHDTVTITMVTPKNTLADERRQDRRAHQRGERAQRQMSRSTRLGEHRRTKQQSVPRNSRIHPQEVKHSGTETHVSDHRENKF